jgi:hypothetical protein
LWCIWKARNDALFGRKFCKPSQVYPALNAILQGSKIEGRMDGQEQLPPATSVQQETSLQEPMPPASSPLEAEAYGFLLATKLADSLRIHRSHFYTDCSVLASAAALTSIFKEVGHSNIRPIIASIQASSSFMRRRLTHINRCYNIKAHHQAKLATRISNRPVALRCIYSDTGACTE